jgi:hypothetical protein
MARYESPDSQFDRLKRQLQDTILSDYPNPERKGCPGDPALRELAACPLEDNLEQEPRWRHITHCSECYREFLGFRTELKQRAKTRGAKVGMAAAVAAVLIAAGTFVAIRESIRPKRSENAEVVFRQRLVDLQGRAVTRSEEGKEETKPIVLQREPEALTIRLPFGSREGAYEVQIAKSADQPLLSAGGAAKVENGTTALTAKMDLSKFEPGNYFICVRRLPWDWTCYPVVIR